MKNVRGLFPGPRRRIWRELRRAFELAKNVELQNYAEYRLRVLDEANHSGAEKLAATASRWFWGYGFRPMRTLPWLVLVVLVFATVRAIATTTTFGNIDALLSVALDRGHPVLMQAGASPRGREFATRWAEAISAARRALPPASNSMTTSSRA